MTKDVKADETRLHDADVRNAAERLRAKIGEAWFAQGPLDPRLALLRVDVDHAEYWDEHSRGVIRLLALAHCCASRRSRRPNTTA